MTPRLLDKLASEGFAVRRAVRLSRRAHASSLRLDLVDGQRIKLRTFKTTAVAENVWRLLRRRTTTVLPRPLLHVTRTLLLEFVEGTRLDRHLAQRGAAEDSRQLRALGDVLAQIHSGPVPRGHVQPLSEYRRLVTRMMRRLARQGLLGAEVAERLAAIPSPRTLDLARTHGDLQPMNLIVTDDGRLRAIDVERMAVRPVGFDLARTVQLWSLTRRREHALIDEYAAQGGHPDGYLAHRAFWTVVALSTSVAFSLVHRPKSVRPIAARLEDLAATLA